MLPVTDKYYSKKEKTTVPRKAVQQISEQKRGKSEILLQTAGILEFALLGPATGFFAGTFSRQDSFNTSDKESEVTHED